VGFPNFPHNTELIIKEISKIMCALFIIRMINKEFQLNSTLLKIDKKMSVDKKTGICQFDFDKYLEDYINLNKKIPLKNDILSFASKIKNELPEDDRHKMNGHDFVEILFNYLNKVKNTSNFNLESFEKAFLMAVQPNYLEDYELFKKLEFK
jgi:hypothetical protein